MHIHGHQKYLINPFFLDTIFASKAFRVICLRRNATVQKVTISTNIAQTCSMQLLLQREINALAQTCTHAYTFFPDILQCMPGMVTNTPKTVFSHLLPERKSPFYVVTQPLKLQGQHFLLFYHLRFKDPVSKAQAPRIIPASFHSAIKFSTTTPAINTCSQRVKLILL